MLIWTIYIKYMIQIILKLGDTNLEFEAHCHDNCTAAHSSQTDQSQSAPASPVHQRHLEHRT